ncbi:hypothetical protein TARUN_9028 [Trichoderma arundinaceum]|uniref:Uncharacterized protein n=1 Tax=Trichoderma arundinaceum TaxID=490622 RepID=A0A395NAV0_TRIAR|nr:hypothetical protein TARUN_9028 [Trichoderma arundinaceum]
MPSSRRDYPSSMYPECGSSYGGSYGGNSSRDGYPARRNNDRYRGYDDYTRSRDRRHEERGLGRERHSRDVYTDKRDHYHNHSRDRNNNNSDGKNSNHRNNKDKNKDNSTSGRRSSSISATVLEKFLPPDFRPSQADPEARHHRLTKEKECEGFDWTPGVVLALVGATALFSVERSLIKRQKKDYIE